MINFLQFQHLIIRTGVIAEVAGAPISLAAALSDCGSGLSYFWQSPKIRSHLPDCYTGVYADDELIPGIKISPVREGLDA